MAWQNTLLDASFKGVQFHVRNVSRVGQRAIALNEYPYTAGADLDDLNLHPRRVKVKAIVYGDDYENSLFQLVGALESPGVGELIHPIHGSMMGLAESWEDEHDEDLVDGAIISFAFVEHNKRDLVFSATSAAAKADAITDNAAVARNAADDAMCRRVDFVSGTAPMPRLTALRDAFAQAKAALTQLLNTTALTTVLSGLDPVLYPRAYTADLLAVVDRALQALPFGGRNLLFDAGSGAAVVVGSGLANFYTARKLLEPARVVLVPGVAAPDAGMLADTAAVQAHAQAHAACALADCAAIVLAGELATPLLERADIEALANAVRAGLQVAIDSARAALDGEGRGLASSALRNAAYAVQAAALAVINQRPPLVQRASPIAGPVRLVAHQIYGDASRATEIARLNTLGRRVYIERAEVLNVYAA